MFTIEVTERVIVVVQCSMATNKNGKEASKETEGKSGKVHRGI